MSPTSAATSVGNVSPGNFDNFPIPARDSTIERHTSDRLRPIEQMMPMPVMARRMEASDLRMRVLRSRASPAQTRVSVPHHPAVDANAALTEDQCGTDTHVCAL